MFTCPQADGSPLSLVCNFPTKIIVSFKVVVNWEDCGEEDSRMSSSSRDFGARVPRVNLAPDATHRGLGGVLTQ